MEHREEEIFRGEIYYVYPSSGVGSEQSAGRPAIVVSNDKANQHSPVIEMVYLTTQPKNSLPTHVDITSAERPSIALCEQIHSVSKFCIILEKAVAPSRSFAVFVFGVWAGWIRASVDR